MLRIRCPWCGERDETEFRYRGDASQTRPAADAGLAAFNAYVYERANPRAGTWSGGCMWAAVASC
jgi:sarcosine oxidase subunit delta